MNPPRPSKTAAGPLLTIVGSLLALAGTMGARGSPIAAHAVLATGVVAFFFGFRRQRSVARDLPLRERASASRWPLVGLAVVASADTAAVAGLSDTAVFVLWLTGEAALVSAVLVSRLGAVEAATLRIRESSAVGMMVGVAALVNLYRLADFPPAVHGDVGEIALTALSMNVARDIFRPSTTWWGIPGMHNALQLLGLRVADGLTGARLTDAVLGSLFVIPLVAVLRDSIGLKAALVAGALAIGSQNMMNTWRSGLGLGPPPFLALFALWAFQRGMRSEHSPRDFFLLAGIAAGIAVQVNLAARIVPVMLACFAAHETAFGSSTSRRRVLYGFCWTVFCALLVAGPLLWHYVQDPAFLAPRSEKFILNEQSLPGAESALGVRSAIGVVCIQVVRSFGMFHYYPDSENAGFFIGERPFFEPLTATLLVLGVVVATSRLRDRRFAWPLIGCALSVLLVASTIHAPGYHRAGPAAALALVIVGFGCASLLRSVEALCEAAHLRESFGRAGATLLAVSIAAAGLAWGVKVYFVDYGRREWPHTSSTEIGKRIAAEPIDGSFTYALTAPAFFFGYGNIRFIALGHKGKDVLPGGRLPTADELAPGVNLFIALPGRAAELRALARKLPEGTLEVYYKRPPWDPHDLEFLVLRIVKTATAARR